MGRRCRIGLTSQPRASCFSSYFRFWLSSLTTSHNRQFLQNFYAAFPEYESRDFALFTESYGGHYGPEFSEYFLEQNAAIDAGTVTGEKINLIALGINNGWIDPLLQYQVR